MRPSAWMFLAAVFFAAIGGLRLSAAMSNDLVLLSSVIFLAAACICRSVEEKR